MRKLIHELKRYVPRSLRRIVPAPIRRFFQPSPLQARAWFYESQLEVAWRISRHGFLVSMTPQTDHDRNFFLHGGYETKQIDRICRVLRDGGHAIDVGAHLGAYALPFSACVGPEGRVLAIEPDPRLFKRLSLHCLLNGQKNVIVENCAITDSTADTISLYLTPHSQNNTIIRDRQITHVKAAGYRGTSASDITKIQVANRRLDDLVRAHGLQPQLIKVDVEGAEFEVLESCRETLRRFHPIVYFENDVFDPNRHKPQETLRSLGYSLYVYDERLDAYIPGVDGPERMILALPSIRCNEAAVLGP